MARGERFFISENDDGTTKNVKNMHNKREDIHTMTGYFPVKHLFFNYKMVRMFCIELFNLVNDDLTKKYFE